VNRLVKENHQISGYFVLFLLHASQTGVGMLNFQHRIVQDAEQDAWIALVVTGFLLHVVLWMLYKLLHRPAKDVIDIHRHCFGKYAGDAASILLIGYFFVIALTVFREYLNILQVWVFPSVPTWQPSLMLLLVFYYLISGGFRVLAGFCFFSVILSTLFMISFFYPLQQGEAHYLFPVFTHSFLEIVRSTRNSSFVFFGFEALLLYFPFLKLTRTTARWAHVALLFSTVKYLVILGIALLYFSQGHLKRTLWPTLEMTKMIELQFLERFEYFLIFLWLMVIIPTVCIPIWCCTRIMKRVFAIKPKLPLASILLVLFIITLQFNDQTEIDALRNFTSHIGFYFLFAYIPLLFVIHAGMTKFKSSRVTRDFP
jgi:spore germination protein (amino acid permease)